MNTTLINLFAAARRTASNAAATSGRSAVRAGLVMARGSETKAALFGAASCTGLALQSQIAAPASQEHAYLVEQHSLYKHPGVTPQVAGGYL